MNSVKKINVKYRMYYLLDDEVNIKNLDPNEMKIDENDLTYYISCETTNSVKPLYLIMNKGMGYVEKIMKTNIWH